MPNLLNRCSLSLLLYLCTGCQLLVAPTDTGERHLSSGQHSAAIDALKPLPVSSERNRLLARSYRTRASGFLRSKRCELALNDLESAAELEPRLKLDYQLTDRCFATAQKPPPVVLAQFLFDGGDTRTRVLSVLLSAALTDKVFDTANQLARTLVSRNVWQAETAHWLARTALAQKRLSDGRFWLLKLVTREKPTAYLLTRLAMTCAQLKDDNLAHRYFSEAWSLKPGNPVILTPWRKVCKRLGNQSCVARIDAQNSPGQLDRQLRPLLKSKR